MPNGTTVVKILSANSLSVSPAPIASLPRVGLNFETGLAFAYYDGYHPLCADRVDKLTFYCYSYVTGKVYRSIDGGVTWSVANSANRPKGNTNLSTKFGLRGGQGQALKAVEGNAGHLFASAGGGGHLICSTDYGTTWARVGKIEACVSFGFGKAKPGGLGYPAIFVNGTVSRAKGFFRSDDNAETVDRNVTIPIGSLDIVTGVDGDKNEFGRFYVSCGGSGWAYGKLDYAER